MNEVIPKAELEAELYKIGAALKDSMAPGVEFALMVFAGGACVYMSSAHAVNAADAFVGFIEDRADSIYRNSTSAERAKFAARFAELAKQFVESSS